MKRYLLPARWSRIVPAAALLGCLVAVPAATSLSAEAEPRCQRKVIPELEIGQVPGLLGQIAAAEKAGPEAARLPALLDRLGAIYEEHGRFGEAERVFGRALEIREKSGAPAADIATTLATLSIQQRSTGKPLEAIASLTRCVKLAEAALGPESVELSGCLTFLGLLYTDTGRYAEAEPLLKHAFDIRRARLGVNHAETAMTTNILGGLYRVLGDHARSEQFYRMTLDIREKVLGPCNPWTATALSWLATLYFEMNKLELALPLHQRALRIREQVRGLENHSVALSLMGLGQTLLALGRHGEAAPVVERGLALHEKIFGPYHPRTLLSLWSLAQVRMLAGRHDEAEALLRSGLQRVSATEAPDMLWRFQDAYRAVMQGKGQPAAAIYFGKQAVNSIQALRAGIAALERDVQRGFVTQERFAVYRTLADLLIEQGRLVEAQQVLAMLKEEEFFDFIRRDGKGDPRATRSTLTEAEEPYATRYAEISGQVAALGMRREELQRKRGVGLSAAEEAEFKKVEESLQTARAGFVAFLDGLVKDLSRLDAERRVSADRQRRDVEGMAKYQRHLKRLGPGTVMLHYVVLPDKVRIILSTHNNQIGYASAIEEKALNQKIQAFREALQYSREDPRPAGNELYQALMAPIARDLRQLGARTLILSLDGVLRYIPFAALHDGSRYLIQDYQLALVTEAADIRLTAEAGRPSQFAGLGLTRQVPGFDPLPAVKDELEGILRAGGIKGAIYLDQAFTAERMRQALKQEVSLLHVASHFVFRPGTEADSYLLLGDGGRLSLRDLRIADYDFQDVELLTLSACDTATGGGSDANGREVEGLGVLAQQKGARAVMATLWPVADASTGILMQNFYRQRAGQPGVTKAEALRQAQLALLTGQHAQAATSPGAEQRGAGRSDRAPRFAPDPAAPYAHPYFWAPFILMGNWL